MVVCLALVNACAAWAGCRTPVPRPVPFTAPAGQGCPSGYTTSGSTCAPSSSSAPWVLVVPRGHGCPSNYTQSGQMCMAGS